MDLKSDEAARVRCVTLGWNGGGSDLVAVDPSGHLIALCDDAEVIPFSAFDEGVVANLILRSEPASPSLAEDVPGAGSFGRVLGGEFHLGAFDAANFLFSLWRPVSRTDLNPAVELRIDQLGFKLELEVAVFRVRAEKGGAESFFGGSDDRAIFDSKRPALVAFRPAVEVFSVEERG